MKVEQIEMSVQGRPARVFCGGSGDALLLVHGGWGGAHLHWSCVWEQLARSHRVIAPDLPGLGAVEQQALGSVEAYARWLADLLTVLGVDHACVVGNSFGASVAWCLASRLPERCARLVLVNGFAMPRTPALLRLAGRTTTAHAIMAWLLRRLIYTPTAVARAFADPARVPADLARVMAQEWDLIIPHYVDALIAGDGSPPPKAPIGLLWGAADRLPGSSRKDLERLSRSLHGSKAYAVEGAGHFPQIEHPEVFVAALENLLI